jgi:Zn-dependent protease
MSTPETPTPEEPIDIPYLQREVGQRFPFYDMKVTPQALVFFCHIDEPTINDNFEALRLSIKDKGYIPMLQLQNGEYLLYIMKKQHRKTRSIYINIVLLAITIITTTMAGAILWFNYNNPTTNLDILTYYAKSLEVGNLLFGFLTFSLPLMLILGIHETGHYLVSRKHHVEASLPFFIPLPPIPGALDLGTFGAVISTRDPIPNRKALLHIGASGPICGFLTAIPVVIIGFFLMQQNPVPIPASAGSIQFIPPLLIQWIGMLFTIPSNAIIHPTLFAGWVGIFLTAVNLLPVGQLDGGHVARAVFKDKHRYISWGIVIMLLALGLFYTGWFMFAFIVLIFLGTQHQPPLNEFSPLERREILIALAILVIFILSFAPIPFSTQ